MLGYFSFCLKKIIKFNQNWLIRLSQILKGNVGIKLHAIANFVLIIFAWSGILFGQLPSIKDSISRSSMMYFNKEVIRNKQNANAVDENHLCFQLYCWYCNKLFCTHIFIRKCITLKRNIVSLFLWIDSLFLTLHIVVTLCQTLNTFHF